MMPENLVDADESDHETDNTMDNSVENNDQESGDEDAIGPSEDESHGKDPKEIDINRNVMERSNKTRNVAAAKSKGGVGNVVKDQPTAAKIKTKK